MASNIYCDTTQTVAHSIGSDREIWGEAMVVKDNLLPKCIICENTPAGGISEGVFIGKKFLCASCEMKIVRLGWNDDDYHYYTQRLKGLWA